MAIHCHTQNDLSPDLSWLSVISWGFSGYVRSVLREPTSRVSPILSPYCPWVGMHGYSPRQHSRPAVHQSDSRLRGPLLLVHTGKRTSVNYSTCSIYRSSSGCAQRMAGHAINSRHTSSSSQDVTPPHHSGDGYLGQGWQGGSCLETVLSATVIHLSGFTLFSCPVCLSPVFSLA